MNRRSALRLGAPLVLAATMVAACSSSKSSTQASPPGSSGPAVSGTLNGSGSSFQQAYDAAAIDAFTKAHSGVTINYNPTGSGQGQADLENQLVNLAGSDVPVASADLSKFKGGAILYFPTVAGPITVSYNLPGLSTLQLSSTTLAGLFQGTIKTWNAPAVVADNPGVTLPGTAVTVVHRSDASGTTANFTAYLKAAAGSAWTLGTGKTLTNWPRSSSQAGKGNPGVAQIVKSTSGAIGYVDYSDAKADQLTFAAIKNKSGKYVAASLAGASAAVAAATVNPDLTYDPIDAPGDTAYPITSPTYIIVYQTQANAGTATLLRTFLQYVDGTDGQALASTVDFAPISTSLASTALAQVAKITG